MEYGLRIPDTPPPITSAAALEELQTLGLIGKGNGLTRKGSIKREQLALADLDAMFS